MTQQITDYTAFLEEAKQSVEDLNHYRERGEKLRLEEKRLEKALESEKKAVSDAISLTIKKRQEGINSSYDQEINKGQERLKKAHNKREKAKNQGMKERIEEETSELHSHNRELEVKIKTLFQQNHVPVFCNSHLYYSLYFTRGFSEILTLLLSILVCFLLIPYGIYELIPKQNTLFLIIIYFITIILFGGLYLTINNHTKVPYLEVLKEGRAIRNVIRSNHKKIRVITNLIRKDRNETVYDLELYDDEIARVEQELAEIAHKKKEALNTFETVTKTIISDEIMSNSKARLEQLQQDYRNTDQSVKEIEKQIKEKVLWITDHYEAYVGREFLEPAKLSALSELIRSGSAENISEAIETYHNTRTEG